MFLYKCIKPSQSPCIFSFFTDNLLYLWKYPLIDSQSKLQCKDSFVFVVLKNYVTTFTCLFGKWRMKPTSLMAKSPSPGLSDTNFLVRCLCYHLILKYFFIAVKQTIKQLCKRASRPTTKDLRCGRVPYEPKKAPPFTLQQLMRMRQYCLKTVDVFAFVISVITHSIICHLLLFTSFITMDIINL